MKNLKQFLASFTTLLFFSLSAHSAIAAVSSQIVRPAAGVTFPVSLPTTQPVSLATLPPLAAGSATIGTVNAGTGFPSTTTAGSSGTNLITIQGSSSGVGVPVTGTFWQSTQPVSLASLPALAAGSNAIGQVGGKTAQVSVTPTVTASSAYAAGNEVGGLMTFSNALLSADSGALQSIHLQLKSVQTVGFKLYLFRSNPSNSTWTDKSTPSMSSSDLAALVGVYAISSGDSGLGTMSIYNLEGIGKYIQASGTTLYGVLVTTGTPTFSSTSDVNVVITMSQD